MKKLSIAIIDIIGLKYNSNTLNKSGLGGSESAIILMSNELVKIGFDVTVYNNLDISDKLINYHDLFTNVIYHDIMDIKNHECHYDIVILSRSVKALLDENYSNLFKSNPYTILWMHDTFCDGDSMVEKLVVDNKINEIFTLSDFHTSYITNCLHHNVRRNFEVLKNKIFQTRNGINIFKDEIDLTKKDRNLFVYNSSVSKGMTPLIKYIWPMVKQKIPSAKLKIIGGYYNFSNGIPDEQELQWHELKNNKHNKSYDIEFTGVITQKEISDILEKSSFMIYPTTFPETFGISSMEALYHNVPIITCRFGAMEETAIDKACYLIDYPIEPNSLFTDINVTTQIDKFVDMVIKAYNDTYLYQQKQNYCNVIKDICSWKDVALQWKQHIYKKLGYYLSMDDYNKVSYINDKVHRIFNRRFSNSEEWNTIKTNPENNIAVIVPFYNSRDYLEKCLLSITQQNYDNYTIYMIDDNSTDGGFELCQKLIETFPVDIQLKIILCKNSDNKGALCNQVNTIRKLIDDTIVMLVDGDDWLVNDNNIFNFYNNLYNEGYEFTYGSCWSVADNIPLIAQEYPHHIKQSGKFREYKFNWGIPYTHLRTFKKDLINNINDDIFKDSNGNWYKSGGDVALFYAIIEKANPKNIKTVQEVFYNYNDANPLNDYKVNKDEQNKNAKEIMNKTKSEKYTVVIPTMWKCPQILSSVLNKLTKYCYYVDEIIIINNNMRDLLKVELPVSYKLNIYNNSENMYVNPSWNFGVEKSTNEKILILNDDLDFDVDVFAKVDKFYDEDFGVIGLCPGKKEFNQPLITDGSIDIIEWNGQHTFGFGCMMFVKKSEWVNIPDELKIYYGDNFIFDRCLADGKKNYLITNIHYTTPFAATTSDKNIVDGFLEKESIIYNNILLNRLKKKLDNYTDQINIKDEYIKAINTPSDINEHLDVLKHFADKCETITEFGVRTGISTRAFLNSSARVISYDIEENDDVRRLFNNINCNHSKNHIYGIGNVLNIEIDPTDMLFIDTFHEYTQLKQELKLHGGKVNKYIAFHDTFTYGLNGDKGILPAIIEFMIENPEWKFVYHTIRNNGLIVIEKTNGKNVMATKKKILIAIPTAKYIESDTFKSIYDVEIPDGYEVDFQYFYGYRVDQVRNLIADWVIKGYDYLFSVDHDIVFPKDTLIKLVNADKDIISGLYRQRKNEEILEIYDDSGNVPYSRLHNKGITEIIACGFGCVLVKKEVLQKIGYPQFEYHHALNHDDTISEDWDFCAKARKNGYKLYADTSILCDHKGDILYKIETSFSGYPIRDRLSDLSNQTLLPVSHVNYLKAIKGGRHIYPSVIYDIGSCVLHWTKVAKDIWPDSKIYCFEAMEEVEFLYSINSDIIEDYDVGNVVTNVDYRTIDFYQNTYHPGGNSYYKENVEVNPNANEYFNESNKLKKVGLTLDTIVELDEFLYPDLIKMDVQGAELDVLKGAKKCLSYAKWLILELQHVEYNKGAPLKNEVIDYLGSIGFKLVGNGAFCNNGFDGDYFFEKISGE